MDLSNPPKDILGLGKYLVRELDFADGVDTLGRWMSHHLAELIHESENGKTVGQQTLAKEQATEIILKIWDHRKVLPGEAYPLAEFQNVLKVIERLKIENDPYRFYGHNFQDSKDQIASMLFDNFTRLILSLLLSKINYLESLKKTDKVVVEALNEEEQQVLVAIHEWFTLFPVETDKKKTIKKSKKSKEPEEFDLIKNALNLIDSIKKLLTELKKELQNKNK